MKIRVLFAVLVLFATATVGSAQEGNTYFIYPANDDCAGNHPLTFDTCWTGTGFPDGTPVEVYKNGTLCWTFDMISGEICAGPGYFNQWDPCMANNGDQLYVQVSYQGCTYTSRIFTVSGAPEPQFYYLVESDWITCDCGTDPCGVIDASQEGTAGPYDIPNGDTLSFIDMCTVRVTAQGGAAHGVSVRVYDQVPQYHPTGFSYMSRVVAIYWDGSADPSTTLLVRMYYTPSEFNESGFSSPGCLIAARFDEFATHWTPIPPTGSGSKYIEFVTDRSGYITFDCRGTTPRRIPIGDPTVSSGDRELVVRWQTVDEFENYRFHILRAEKSEGPYVEIATVNSQLPDIGTTASYNYEYRDSGLENGRAYYYQLSSEDLHGNTVDGLAAVSGVPSLYGDAVQIDEYRLHAAYPNPFNPETRLTYDVRDAGRVTLCVFDILGREVARLVDSEQARGRYSVTFNAKDLPSGLYFYRIDIGGQFTSTQKMLLLK